MDISGVLFVPYVAGLATSVVGTSIAGMRIDAHSVGRDALLPREARSGATVVTSAPEAPPAEGACDRPAASPYPEVPFTHL